MPLREYMRDYIHWATLGALCEFLPQPENRVTLADEKDRHGLPVAHFANSQCDNDRQLPPPRASMESILRAAGADEVMTIERYAHLVGGARMADRAEDGVVDADHRVFDIPNLFIVDGSTLPTQGAANPALTIMSLAARAADRIRARAADRAATGRAPHEHPGRRHRSHHPRRVPLRHPATGSRRHPALGCHHRGHRADTGRR